jgi:3-oxoacyl-[acyl-carrier-protein] synthase-1/3-oxoacyl-[acyl-carrier-protein] synthase II
VERLADRRVFITGMGIVSPMGHGVSETLASLQAAASGIRPLTLFPCPFDTPLPVGEVRDLPHGDDFPRTHQLALAATREALGEAQNVPDMVIMGVTTGGMLSTENYMKQGHRQPRFSPYHAAGSVADVVAEACRCRGPVLTVSTACSSGAVGIKLALEILRRGAARSVLVGGADSLCRLTYYGFNSLQIVDRSGPHPMDRDRHGMSVAEGAAMLLLTAADQAPSQAIAEVVGGGLSCDAYHPAAPHPEGRGAREAMLAALEDAGLSPDAVDYINLHGTGTVENDLAEAAALKSLFTNRFPPVSSVKGSFGHSLAAAGAIEAVVAALCIREGFMPANVGWRHQDEAIGFRPLTAPRHQPLKTVLSNSFGFGGNNAALVFADLESGKAAGNAKPARRLIVRAYACLTGAGGTAATLERFFQGASCKGVLAADRLTDRLPPRSVRRMKRLARMALGLSTRTLEQAGTAVPIREVYFGTAWGALSETHDFLDKLYASNEFYTSPIDFVGSVHNAPAGQVAMREKARGANVTMTGGDASFEQALTAAHCLAAGGEHPVLVGGADEMHPVFSALFDPSVPMDDTPSDGGGMLLLETAGRGTQMTLQPGYFAAGPDMAEALQAMVACHGGNQLFTDTIGAVMVGIPAARRNAVTPHLEALWTRLGFRGPVIDYRRYFGEFASASAVAAAAAMALLSRGAIPAALAGGAEWPLAGRCILLLGLGETITTMLAARHES